jgi:hypothetical protein
MYVQYGFLYLIVTRHKLTVWIKKARRVRDFRDLCANKLILKTFEVMLAKSREFECNLNAALHCARTSSVHTVSDSYPAFFLLIATTSNKNF